MLATRISVLLGCLLWMSSVQAQGKPVGLGVDASLWASGWKNVHAAVVLQEEIRLHVGLGALSSSKTERGIHFRPRPEHFASAMQYSLGLRVLPRARQGQRWSELFGVELAGESFKKAPLDYMPPAGSMFWIRTDWRALIGAECRLDSRLTMSAHLGLGRSVVQGGEGFDENLFVATQNAPGMTRLLGFEILFWM